MEALATYFKGFSEPNRPGFGLEALRSGLSMSRALCEATGLSQALVSKHLKLLNIAGGGCPPSGWQPCLLRGDGQKKSQIHGQAEKLLNKPRAANSLKFWLDLFDNQSALCQKPCEMASNQDQPRRGQQQLKGS